MLLEKLNSLEGLSTANTIENDVAEEVIYYINNIRRAELRRDMHIVLLPLRFNGNTYSEDEKNCIKLYEMWTAEYGYSPVTLISLKKKQSVA